MFLNKAINHTFTPVVDTDYNTDFKFVQLPYVIWHNRSTSSPNNRSAVPIKVSTTGTKMIPS